MKRSYKLFLLLTFCAISTQSIAQEKGQLNSSLTFIHGGGIGNSGGLNIGLEYILFSRIGASFNFTHYFSGDIRYGEFNIDGRYYITTGNTQVYGLVGFSNLNANGNFPLVGDVDEMDNGYNIGLGMNFSTENRLAFNVQIKYSSPAAGTGLYQLGIVYRLTK